MTLHQAIERKGWSIRGLARVMGVSNSTAHRWVHGVKRPSEANLRRLCGVLGADVQLGWTNPRTEVDKA